MHTRGYTCIHTCMYPYVYVFICACMCVFIHTCMNECIHVYVHAHMAWGHAWMYASSCVCRRVHVHVYGRRRHVTTHSWGALCMHVHARGTNNSIHSRKICAYKRSSKSFAQTRIPQIPTIQVGHTYVHNICRYIYMCVRKYVDTYFYIGNKKVILGENVWAACVGSIGMWCEGWK
jgi:hypothetical protein